MISTDTAAQRIAALIRTADGSAADRVEDVTSILREAGLEVDAPTAGDLLDAVSLDAVTWTPEPDGDTPGAYVRGWMISGRAAGPREAARLAELLDAGDIAIAPHDPDAVLVAVTAVRPTAGKAAVLREALAGALADGVIVAVEDPKAPAVDSITEIPAIADALAVEGERASEIPDEVDLDMLATDLAGTLARYGYDEQGLDLGEDSLRPHLEAFLNAALAHEIPFVNEQTGARPGYVAGRCGHAVALSEWRAGFRNCERCGS